MRKKPNCNLCRWISVKENREHAARCSACGYKYTESAYNSKSCKKSFEYKEKES